MYARVLALAGLVASASAFAPAALPTRAPRKFCAVAFACCEELWPVLCLCVRVTSFPLRRICFGSQALCCAPPCAGSPQPELRSVVLLLRTDCVVVLESRACLGWS